MRLIKGASIRNIEFLKFDKSFGYGIWKCPFCGSQFKCKIENVTDNGNLFSCGCIDSDTARAVYYEKIVDALKKNNFVVTAACREAGVTVGMYKSFMDDIDFKERVLELQEDRKDVIEQAFMKGVLNGNTQLILAGIKSKLMADRDLGPVLPDATKSTSDCGERIVDDIVKFQKVEGYTYDATY